MYIVFAYRDGDLTGYHFPVGVFPTIGMAKEAAYTHHEHRGGKYDHRIWSMEIGKEYDAEEAQLVVGYRS